MTDQTPERTIHADDLGGLLRNDDLIRNTIANLEGPRYHPAFPLRDAENWDYDEIRFAWDDRAAEQLAEHGIRWDQSTDQVTLPAGMDDDTAQRLWDEVGDGCEPWLIDLVDEVREGRGDAPGNAVRSESARGGRWVIDVEEDQ